MFVTWDRVPYTMAKQKLELQNLRRRVEAQRVEIKKLQQKIKELEKADNEASR